MKAEVGGVYEVVIIEEGLGNLGDLSYYSREALQFASDKKVFEGKKAYANHPDKLEEQIRPERSVRDIIGYYSDTQIKNGDTGQAQLVAKFNLLAGEEFIWAKSLVETALTVSGKFDSELVGFSINAGGSTVKKSIDDLIRDDNLPISVKPKLLKAKEQGATEVDYLTELSEAVSCDLVTDAGARGRALKKLIESERNQMAKENKHEGTPPPKAPPAGDAGAEEQGAVAELGDGDQDQAAEEEGAPPPTDPQGAPPRPAPQRPSAPAPQRTFA